MQTTQCLHALCSKATRKHCFPHITPLVARCSLSSQDIFFNVWALLTLQMVLRCLVIMYFLQGPEGATFRVKQRNVFIYTTTLQEFEKCCRIFCIWQQYPISFEFKPCHLHIRKLNPREREREREALNQDHIAPNPVLFVFIYLFISLFNKYF